MFVCNDDHRYVKQIRGREAGLATVEASLTLASLGQGPHEEGGGHAWLPAYVRYWA